MKKLAIIGCGGIGTYHLSHVVNFQDIVELAGFCDLIPERAESFVKEAGCGKAFTDYIEMLDEIKPDMVFVCVYPTSHGPIEKALIERGIHFFVEKPVALTLDLAREIRDLAKAKNLITASGFQCRYSPLVEPNKKFIEENEVLFIDCIRMGGVPGVDWWKKRSTSGGQIVEQTIHQFDIIRYVFGEPESVFTYGTKGFIKMDNYDTEDLSTTVVKFKSGALATMSTGCYAESGAAADSKITFSARNCRAELSILTYLKIFGVNQEKADSSGLILSNDGTMKSTTGGAIEYNEVGDAGVLCDRTFIEAVISGDGSKIRSPYSDAVKTLAFTLACNQSMDTGLPVTIELDK